MVPSKLYLVFFPIVAAIWVKSFVEIFPPLIHTPPPVRNPDLSSGRVSLGDGDFVLRIRDRDLHLEHEKNNFSKRVQLRNVRNSNIIDLSPRADVATKVEQVELTRWSRDSLVGVIKLSSFGKAKFYVFTITHTQLASEVLEASVFHEFGGESNEKILAVCGTVSSPQITVVTGIVTPEDHGIVISGRVTVSPYGSRGELKSGVYSVEYQSVAE